MNDLVLKALKILDCGFEKTVVWTEINPFVMLGFKKKLHLSESRL